MATWTYDPDTPAGKVRLLTTDTAVTDPEVRIFRDEEIAAFLSLADDNVLGAAAFGLEAIAASEVLIQKRIRLLDLATDGPAEARELRALAESYRARAAAGEGDDTDDWLPDWAEMVVDDPTYVERVTNEVLRDG